MFTQPAGAIAGRKRSLKFELLQPDLSQEKDGGKAHPCAGARSGHSRRQTRAEVLSRLFLFADAQGAPFLPVFSGAALIPGDLPAQAFPVQLKGKDALAQVRGKAAVVLNPGQANFKYFSVSDVENILDRLVAPAAEAASGAITHEHDHGQGHSHASAPLQISTFSEEDWNLIGRPKQSESPASRGPHSVV